MKNSPLVYASFDRFPAPKGASTHIASFAGALGARYGPVDLVTLPGKDGFHLPDMPGVRHHPLPALGENMIARTLAFRSELARWWGGRRVPLVHVRSIYEGYPIAKRKQDLCDFFIYEVNGFPSVELKYHHPAVDEDDELRRKLIHQEDQCMEAADLILTVSEINANYIRSRGVASEKIRVIPNGVDLDVFQWQPPRPRDERPLRVVYTGTMTRWQGVHQAIEAVQLFRRDYPAELVLAGPCRSNERKLLYRTIDRLGMAEHVTILEPLNQPALVDLLHDCDVALAPLPPNDRNLKQGCCPLKVLEAMAAGTPLVASDIPVVSALAKNETEAILVRPGSAKAIKDGMLRLYHDPHLGLSLSKAARARVEGEFTWQTATEKLLACYQDLLPDSQPNA